MVRVAPPFTVRLVSWYVPVAQVVFELMTTLPDWAWADAPVNATNAAAVQIEESIAEMPMGSVFLVFIAIPTFGTHRSAAD
jgi:hypothetical protein